MNGQRTLGLAGAAIAVVVATGTVFAVTSQASNSHKVFVPNLSRDDSAPYAGAGGHIPAGWPHEQSRSGVDSPAHLRGWGWGLWWGRLLCCQTEKEVPHRDL